MALHECSRDPNLRGKYGEKNDHYKTLENQNLCKETDREALNGPTCIFIIEISEACLDWLLKAKICSLSPIRKFVLDNFNRTVFGVKKSLRLK